MQLPILPAPTIANLVYSDMSWHYPLCVRFGSIELSPGLYLFCFPSTYFQVRVWVGVDHLSLSEPWSAFISAPSSRLRKFFRWVTLQLTEQNFLS